MKKLAFLLMVTVLACAAPAFAQGPFTDVPTDHWAYDAVSTLQKDGILIGYPDGTFGGKRTITRYEFAVAIARILPMIPPTQTNMDTSKFATKEELNAVKAQIPSISGLATKADVEAIRKLVDEFRDEIAALGVDVDAAKKDVQALGCRVDALEAEARRVKITGDANVFGIASAVTSQNAAFDLDNRRIENPKDSLMNSIGVVQDYDLNIVGRVNAKTTAVATIDYGNYLNYLGFVDDYAGGVRPTTKGGNNFDNTIIGGDNGTASRNTLSDTFFPYYLYINTGFCKGDMTVGRFPLQFTPYTLKKIDVDSYTDILKTNDGNYPMDGVKVGTNFSGVDVTLFAAKNDENDYLRNGLTGQPNSGLFSIDGLYNGFHQLAVGQAVGGLNQVTQSAGARLTVGTPWNGTLGGTFYQAWDGSGIDPNTGLPLNFDQAQVYGADLNLQLPFLSGLGLVGSWTQSNTLAAQFSNFTDVNYDNQAWDAKLNYTFGGNACVPGLGVGAGYKSIGRNFAAAGAWDKIGRWTDPTDVQGPYADVIYPYASNLKLQGGR